MSNSSYAHEAAMEREEHWSQVYTSKETDQVSWYAKRLERSLSLIAAVCPRGGAVIDVGGGASTLVDDLIGAGYDDVTVLDISQRALDVAKARLGRKGDPVRWILGDITSVDLPADRYDVWHDRATFHFLTDPRDRSAYAARVRRAVKPGGHLVMATFAPDGPTRCSGLEIRRYDGPSLAQELAGFELVGETREAHLTPSGAEQRFAYSVLRKSPAQP